MKLHAPRPIDPFTPSNTPQGWTHPLKLHRRDPTAPILRPTEDTEDSKDIKPSIDLSVIAPYGGAQKAKKDLFKPKTKQVFHADPNELALRNEERTPWVLEDFDGKNTWVGTLEQGGASGYALFLFDNDGFKFVPVDRTYRFSKKANTQVLTAEEAEAQMKNRNALPRWILKDKPGLAGGVGAGGGAGGRPGSQLFTVRETRERAVDAMEEDLDYDAAERFEDDEENPILEGDEEANKAIEERMRREQMGARNFESKEEEIDEDIDLDELFGNKKVTKEGKRTKRYLKKLEGKADYDTDEEEENPYATEEETDSEAESLEKQEKEKEKAKVASASGTKPSSPSSTTDVKPSSSTPTPGVSPTQKKKKDRDRAGTATPKPSQHRKKDSSGVLTPNKGPSRRPSPKPDTSRAGSPGLPGPPSRSGSPLGTPASGGPSTPTAVSDPPATQPTTIPGAPSAAPPPAPSSKSLIVRFQISPAGRKRLREEEALAPVKRIKFNLKSGGQNLSPSPPPEDRRSSIAEQSRTASPDDYLITEEEIVNLIRGERLTTKQLLARLKGKLKRNEGNKAIVGGVLKRRCRIVEGFLVLKD